MSDSVLIQQVSGPIVGRIRPPGSKSITNRALVCAALAEGSSQLTGALDSDDTQVMVGALKSLGLNVVHDKAGRTIAIDGCGGRFPRQTGDLFIGNSGTTVRFLTAMLAVGEGRFRLHGTPRMHQRPIDDLLTALKSLQVDVRDETGNGCPPVVVEARGLNGGTAEVRSGKSSQFLSGLLMAAPYARSPLTLIVPDALVSKPYITMTLDVMRAFGVDCSAGNLLRFAVPQGKYRGCRYSIEPDASAASYFFAAAAITGGRIEVEGLKLDALQGDVKFVDVLRQMGCQVEQTDGGIAVTGGKLRGVEVDMNAISDTVQTLAPVALFAEGSTTVRGVGHIRHKETDRIRAVAVELRKLGATVDEFDDGLRITPPARLQGAKIATYDDHRMAMSFALVGLRAPGVEILDPRCTHKTYPEFFADFGRLCGVKYNA